MHFFIFVLVVFSSGNSAPTKATEEIETCGERGESLPFESVDKIESRLPSTVRPSTLLSLEELQEFFFPIEATKDPDLTPVKSYVLPKVPPLLLVPAVRYEAPPRTTINTKQTIAQIIAAMQNEYQSTEWGANTFVTLPMLSADTTIMDLAREWLVSFRPGMPSILKLLTDGRIKIDSQGYQDRMVLMMELLAKISDQDGDLENGVKDLECTKNLLSQPTILGLLEYLKKIRVPL